jgi:hypothetical protein
MWKLEKRIKAEDGLYPEWAKIKDEPFPQANGTFEEVIGAVDKFLLVNGIEIPKALLEYGHHAFLPGVRKETVEDVLGDSEANLHILRNLIFLSPKNGEPLAGEWVKNGVEKKKFRRMWEFSIYPGLKDIQKLYRGCD